MASNQLILKFLLKYPLLVFLNVVLGFSSAIFNGIGTALVVPLLAAFVSQSNGFNTLFKGAPPVLRKLISVFDVLPENSRVIAIFGTVLLAIILKNAANYAKNLVSGHHSRALINNLTSEGIDLLLAVDLDYYSKHKLGDIMHYVNNEIGRTSATVRTIVGLFATLINITLFLVILVSLSWQLTLISTALLSLIVLTNQHFVKKSREFGKIASQKTRLYSNKLFEILTGIRWIKTVSNEEYEYESIKKLILDREKANFEAQLISGLIGPFNEVSGIFAVFIMILLGHYLFAQQLKSFSAIFLIYLVFLFRLLPFISQLNTTRNQLANQSHSVDITADFLQRDNKPFMGNGHEPYKKLEKGIRFEQVCFSYPKNDNLVLDRVDLWIPKGKMTALVGASGAGKSTIADLLPRFYDPTEGRITFDGKDLRDYDLKTIRQAMGIVSQDTFLFNNSVRYNISYGQNSITEEEIVDAAKRANAYEFIVRLPKGFDTEIGDRGVLLSGGQRQRIAIARALLRDPDILILDEATSALDTESERLVQQAIDNLSQERTTLVVAHRLSTIQKAYQIVALDKGRIVEIGNHQELLAKDGYYNRLYSMQFAAEESKI
jgi:subfamily B ATP-binding cassette protein MsbA